MKYLVLLFIFLGCNSSEKSQPPTTATLEPCPKKPNCVISYNIDSERFLDPIKVFKDIPTSKEAIKKIITSMDGAKIVKEEENYLHAEYTSSFFKFVDDVEFLFGDEKFIHFRSASRKGYYDLGVNKKRIETIRFRFHQHDY